MLAFLKQKFTKHTKKTRIMDNVAARGLYNCVETLPSIDLVLCFQAFHQSGKEPVNSFS